MLQLFRTYSAFFLAAILLICSCDRYPQDQRGTIEQVQGDILKVGVVENPPYIIFSNGALTGIEVELIRQFAGSLNARIDWVKGTEGNTMLLLENGQINLAAGGFPRLSPWKKHVYFANPHDTLIFKWGVPPGTSLPGDLKDKEVFVRKGSVAGAYVHQAKGKPIYRDSLTGKEPLAAAPVRDLQRLGFTLSKKDLNQEKISLAIQRGENAFLEKLDAFIYQYENGNQN